MLRFKSSLASNIHESSHETTRVLYLYNLKIISYLIFNIIIRNNWDKQLERNQNHCDGMVLYALTGSLPEILSIKEFNLENF